MEFLKFGSNTTRLKCIMARYASSELPYVVKQEKIFACDT